MLQDLLVVEDESSLLDFECVRTGVLLWPLIRMMFIRMLIGDLFYDGSLQHPSPVNPGRTLGVFGASLIHNAKLRLLDNRQSDLLLVATGMGNSLSNGKWLNRLCDHFALCLPDRATILEDLYDWRWPFPRHVKRVLVHAPMQARNQILSRLLVRDSHRRLAASLVSLVAHRAESHLQWKIGADRATKLADFLARKIAVLPSQFYGYQSLFSRISPKVLIVEAGCYGPSTAMLAAAKAMGICTAEYQHGAISGGHDGYNVAPTLAASPRYRDVLPEYFLGYGRWWNEQINVPISKIAVGNPHRSWQLERVARKDAKKDVLILGDGVDTKSYLSLAKETASLIARHGLRAVFRAHPMERARVQAAWREDVPGLALDCSTDIYPALAASHAVVSEVSTGLFEAVGIADRVFLWDTPKARFAYPVHPFQPFQTATELTKMLLDGELGKVSAVGSEAIWADNWREHFLCFLKSNGVT
jgi:hypothetical protein